MGLSRFALLCVGLLLFGCGMDDSPPAANLPFAMRILDESADARARQGPQDADLIPTDWRGLPGPFWLSREGAIDGPFIAEAHVGNGPGEDAVVEFTLTEEAQDRLAALTRANVGRRLVMVVNGKVVLNTLIAGEAPRTPLMLSGDFTAAEARALADEMMEISRSGAPTP